LDDADLEEKEVVIIGSGASGVEAAESAVEKQAKRTTVIARCAFMMLSSIDI
jgi:dimethylaniline monooxygenase (N-oxide forming)